MIAVETGSAVQASLADLVALRGKVLRGPVRLPNVGAGLAGSHKAGLANRGMEFFESRPYRAGDDVRSIDWRQSARRGVPYTKLFQEERERPVQLLVDLGRSMRFGTRSVFKSVLAARAAALLAWQAVTDGDRVGGGVWDGQALREAQPRARQHGALGLLHHIAEAGAIDPQSATLDGALPAFRRGLRPGGIAVVLSDFSGLDEEGDDSTAAAIASLGQRNDVVLVHVFDALEAEAPAPGIYPVSDGNRTVTLDLRDDAARQAYVAPYAARRVGLEKLARHPRVHLLHLATHNDPAVVQSCLRHRLG